MGRVGTEPANPGAEGDWSPNEEMDVKDPEQGYANWAVEMGSPNALTNRGWTRNSLRVGDQIIVDGWLAKDGRKLANAKSVKFADGRVLLAGSSNEER